MKPVTLHEGAEAELREAMDYYERQRTGLGGEFEAALERARTSPAVYAIDDDASVKCR